jgi:hypothetical protein
VRWYRRGAVRGRCLRTRLSPTPTLLESNECRPTRQRTAPTPTIKRQAVEAALVEAGLVQIAGGTRNSYFGLRGQEVTGYCIRVGIRTFRVVRRFHSGRGITDLSIGREHYHGKANLEKLVGWARKQAETRFGKIETPASIVKCDHGDACPGHAPEDRPCCYGTAGCDVCNRPLVNAKETHG